MRRLLLLIFFLFYGMAYAQAINIERLADAIYWAEGGPKTRYPYGILKRYKYTSPRQACINTIQHSLKDWNRKKDFILFLGKRYCPTDTKTWVKNVRWFYEMQKVRSR